MIKVLEMIVIALFLVSEGAVMTTGNALGIKSLLKKKSRLNDVLAILIGFGALGYLIFAIVWCFSPVLPIQIAGWTLLVMALIQWLGDSLFKETPKTFLIQFDAFVSMLCLATVGYCRIKGF